MVHRTKIKCIREQSQTRNKEGVVCVTCWMLLRLKQRVKVPETTFNKVVGWHLSKTVNNDTTDVLINTET